MLAFADPLPVRPRRIIVAGTSGAGKTTLCRRISTLAGIPHTELDALWHGPHWSVREEFAGEVAELVAQDAWVCEWQYRSVRQLLAERAQLMVWLDLPFLTSTLPRSVRRTVRRSRSQEELWNGNRERPLRTFFTDRDHIVRWTIRTRRKLDVQVPEVERTVPHLTVVRLRSPREVERWLDGAFAAAVG